MLFLTIYSKEPTIKQIDLGVIMKSYFNNYRKLKYFTVACSLVFFTQALEAKSTNYETIGICTMSQNILQDQIFTGMDVTYSNPQAAKDDARKDIKKQLELLKKEKLSKQLHKSVLSLDSSWSKIEKKLKVKTKKENSLSLYTQVNSFTKDCETVSTKLDKKKSDIEKMQVATLNLKVQTLTALYAIKSWDAINDKDYNAKVTNLLKSYETIYKKLNNSKSKVNQDILEKLNKEFTAFKFMTTSSSGRYMPVLAAKKASSIDALTTQILEGK